MTYLAAYLIAALWQVPALFLVTLLLARVTRPLGPTFAHRLWVAALLLQITIPALPASLLRALLRLIARPGPALDTHITISETATAIPQSFGLMRVLLLAFAGVWLASLVYFTARLLWRLTQARALARRATPDLLLPRVYLSADISGPATVGVLHPKILLPTGFAESVLAEDLQAALAHESAHIQRHDFALNIAYQVISLPLAFHPVVHLTLKRIAITREILCDSMAAAALSGPAPYARSLLRLAAALLPASAPALALGIFNPRTLEKRIMILTTVLPTRRRSQRLALAALCVVAALATATSSMALRRDVAYVAAPAPAPRQSEPTPVQVAGNIMATNLRAKVTPVYPEIAKTQHISGTVILHAIIGRDGTLQHLEMVSGPPELIASAMEAVRQWEYKPYLLNGQPTEVDTTIRVNYSFGS